mmetsp:Transcript_4381/g.12074  ORF Transcript_4381/g.12074 Transcript_4381/m.12074 type:complete len:1827 (+) Transcript_4381:66-5546(+)
MLSNFNWLPSWQIAAEREELSRLQKSSSRVVDQDGLTSEEEDQIAAELLSQFPPFGSHEPKDWLSLGYAPSKIVEDDDMFHNSANDQEDALPESVPDSILMHQASSAKNRDALSRNQIGRNEDWEGDEKCLWKQEDISRNSKADPDNFTTIRKRAEQTPYSTRDDWLERFRSSDPLTQNYSPVRASEGPNVDRPQSEDAAAADKIQSTPSRTYFSLRLSPSSEEGGANPLQTAENRQHWMPDQLCKQCYSCETHFTVFRRRHHCRLCGQVFCNQCSAFFVPHKGGTTVRVCILCHEQVAERGGVLQDSKEFSRVQNVGGTGVVLPFNPADDSPNVTRSTSLVPPAFETIDGTKNDNLREIGSALQKLSDSHVIGNNAFDADGMFGLPENKRRLSFSDGTLAMPPRASLERKTGSSSWMAFAGQTALASLPQSTRFLTPPPVPSRTTSLGGSSVTQNAVNDALREGNQKLGMAAANHLEHICRELLENHAPILWNGLKEYGAECEHMEKHWINQLLTLATRCCATVEPNVRDGDLLDIRPYCKIKVIPGGSYKDCAYLSGVVFRKNVSHKRMAREIENPKIMLLSGGIEFTRTENRIASLETLFEQEDKYTEILVGKILKLKPDILMVGRSASRRAQELLLKAGVVLVQQVKSNLMSRISRQTGATVISSTDHVMNQFGAKVLGSCRRFRLVTFRDNETWVSHMVQDSQANDGDDAFKAKKSIRDLLLNPGLSNQERQAALAADKLGEGVHDGAEAVRNGLAKRGVVHTYIMLEGCPKQLGCTIVLRGSDRVALKQVKSVLRFLVLAAYNLRLETSYLKERRARLRPDFVELPKLGFSTSLCVDYGEPGNGRKVRPWNGGDEAARASSGEITVLDHGALLVTSIWMTEKSQCCPAEVKGICYYSLQDVSLGQFLRDSCFNLSLKCQNPNCKKSVLDHSLSFVHNDGLLNIVVEQLDEPLPPHPHIKQDIEKESDAENEEEETEMPIATWSYCRKCEKVVSPLTFISEDSWKFSFGKFLESFFYNRDAILNAPDHECSCQLQSSAVLYFGCGNLAARFSYEPVRPFEVFVRANLPIHIPFHKEETIRRLELISGSSSELFVNFDKHIERVSREARSLFHSAVARPEHLQTLLSELNRIGTDVDHAAKTIQHKIQAISEECRRRAEGEVSDSLLRFPWFARRYLFLVMSAWNDKLRAAGKAITAMKKLSASGSRSDVGGGEAYNDQLNAGIKKLRELNERYTTFNIAEMTEALSAFAGTDVAQHDDYDDEFEESEIDFSDGVDADVLASRRRYASKPNQTSKNRVTPTKSLGTRRGINDVAPLDSTPSSQPKSTPGGAVKSAFNRFFNRGSRDENAYVVDLGLFAEGRPSLPPGVNNTVIPVFDEQWSSIIAYSLASSEYANQFKHFSKHPSASSESKADGLGNASANSDEMASQGADGRGQGEESSAGGAGTSDGWGDHRAMERRMLVRNKTHIKHTFRDFDWKSQVTCKFVCTSYWATQFHAVRQVFLSENFGKGDTANPGGADVEQSYIESLSSTFSWAASGGKSGASFARTSDDRFVIKCISRTELQMFLDCAPAYFEYLTKAFFHGLPTVLCKIVGVYQIGVHNRVTGKRSMEQVAVMQNIFYNRKITKIFDLKGSLRGRFAANIQSSKDHDSTQQNPDTPVSDAMNNGVKRHVSKDFDENRADGSTEFGAESSAAGDNAGAGTLLDGDFLEFTLGRPMPMTDRAKAVFQMSILNDTLFLSIINVLDYSILVGLDEEKMELVVGIIDFMRQYDILKQMERVGKSLPMVVGSEAPTIIQPPLYKARFTNAMERYFMTVPSKWTTI